MKKHRIKPRREPGKPRSSTLNFLLTVVLPAILVALIARVALVQPFYIPSGSMHPTLIEGDQLLISKSSYGISRHSFPFSPELFDGKILEDLPERGDVVVFRRQNGEDWIKRAIALPGDRIEVKDGRVILNGKPLKVEKVDDYHYVDEKHKHITHTGQINLETLPSGVHYQTLDSKLSRGDNFGPFTVPEGHVFLMGDNRDNSQDSRFIGPIPSEQLLGKAFLIHFSYDWHTPGWAFWEWPFAMNFSRFFKGL